MRKKANKLLALLTAVAITVTGVNVPTNTASAASAKLSKTKITLKAGKKKTIYLKKGSKKLAIKSVKSSNKKVATVKKKGKKIIITAKKLTEKKTAKITVKAKVGKKTKKFTCKVTVKKAAATPTATPAASASAAPSASPSIAPSAVPSAVPSPVVGAEVAKLEASVTNGIEGYENTTLVNRSAILNVKATDKDGNPVQGESVVMTTELIGAGNYASKGDSVVTTDKDGVAVFAIGNTKNGVKSDEDDQIATVTAKFATTNKTYTETKIKFAAVVIRGTSAAGTGEADKSVNVINNDADDAWKAVPADNNVAGTSVSTVKNMESPAKDVEYVSSQQVSPAGTTTNQVKFAADPYIILPDEKQSAAVKETQELNLSTGTVTTNKEYSKEFKLNVDPTKLTYATLNIEKLQVSKYSSFGVTIFTSSYGWKKNIESVDGEINQATKSIQIPINDIAEGDIIRVWLKTPGQVNATRKEGFVVKNIEYVYKTTTAGDAEVLKNASISWDTEAVSYSLDKALTNDVAANVLEKVTDDYPTTGGYTYTYRIPAFPRTGNAIITVKDKNGTVQAYYAVPTENKLKKAATATSPAVYMNENSMVNVKNEVYRISADEADTVINGQTTGASVTTDGNAVIVNSEKAGVTNLVGKVVSKDESLVLDAENDTVYTSVQWNPVKTADNQTTANGGILALKGQTVTVDAQLVDANGNKVSRAGETIKWGYDDTNTTVAIVSPDIDASGNRTSSTDKDGKASLILSSADANCLKDVTATNSSYKVVLTINGGNVEKADVYWIDADLEFVKSQYAITGEAADNVQRKSTGSETADVTVHVYPSVGETWEYEISNKAVTLPTTGFYAGSVWAGKAVTANFEIPVTVSDTSAATNVGKGKATITSTKNTAITLKGTINSSAVTTGMTFTVKDVGDYVSSGTGATNINKSLTVSADFGAVGEKVAFFKGFGDQFVREGVNANRYVYAKITDGYGNDITGDAAEMAKHKVVFTATGATLAADDINTGTLATGAVTVTPDKNGIARVKIDTFDNLTDGVGNATITVKKDGDAAIFDTLIVYQKLATALTVKKISYDNSGTNNNLVIEFSDDIVAKSVVKEMFGHVTYKKAGTGTGDGTFTISSVSVSGSKVIATLNNKPEGVNNDSTFSVDIVPYEHNSDDTNYFADPSTPTGTRDDNLIYAITSAKTGLFLDGKLEIADAKADGTSDVATVATDNSAGLAAIELDAALTTAQETLDAYKAADYTFNKTKFDAAKAAYAAATKTTAAKVNTALTTATTELDKLAKDTAIAAAIKTGLNTAATKLTKAEVLADSANSYAIVGTKIKALQILTYDDGGTNDIKLEATNCVIETDWSAFNGADGTQTGKVVCEVDTATGNVSLRVGDYVDKDTWAYNNILDN